MVILGGNMDVANFTPQQMNTIRKYNEVDTDFARAEGEGDLSLEYWREAHKNFFSRTLSKISKEFSVKMPLVCERFHMIYK